MWKNVDQPFNSDVYAMINIHLRCMLCSCVSWPFCCGGFSNGAWTRNQLDEESFNGSSGGYHRLSDTADWPNKSETLSDEWSTTLLAKSGSNSDGFGFKKWYNNMEVLLYLPGGVLGCKGIWQGVDGVASTAIKQFRKDWVLRAWRLS